MKCIVRSIGIVFGKNNDAPFGDVSSFVDSVPFVDVSCCLGTMARVDFELSHLFEFVSCVDVSSCCTNDTSRQPDDYVIRVS